MTRTNRHVIKYQYLSISYTLHLSSLLFPKKSQTSWALTFAASFLEAFHAWAKSFCAHILAFILSRDLFFLRPIPFITLIWFATFTFPVTTKLNKILKLKKGFSTNSNLWICTELRFHVEWIRSYLQATANLTIFV